MTRVRGSRQGNSQEFQDDVYGVGDQGLTRAEDKSPGQGCEFAGLQVCRSAGLGLERRLVIVDVGRFGTSWLTGCEVETHKLAMSS